jgi:hypothetical protein
LKAYALFSPYIKDSHRDKRARENVHEDEESSSKRHATVASSSTSSPSRSPLTTTASSSPSRPPPLSVNAAKSEAPTGEADGIDSVDRDAVGAARDSENTEVLVAPPSPEQWSELLLSATEQRSPSPDDWCWEEEEEGEEEEEEENEEDGENEAEEEGNEDKAVDFLDGDSNPNNTADPDDFNSGGSGAEGDVVGTDSATAGEIQATRSQRNEEE